MASVSHPDGTAPPLTGPLPEYSRTAAEGRVPIETSPLQPGPLLKFLRYHLGGARMHHQSFTSVVHKRTTMLIQFASAMVRFRTTKR